MVRRKNCHWHNTRRPRFESMERREMMAADLPTAIYCNGEIMVHGTPGRDAIEIGDAGNTVIVSNSGDGNRELLRVDRSDKPITRIVFNGKGGIDFVKNATPHGSCAKPAPPRQ